jgi:hypothetical protein
MNTPAGRRVVSNLAKRPFQIYLKPAQDQALRALAEREGVSLAELIRRSIDRYLAELPQEDDPAMDLIGLGRSGRGNLSTNHDRYLTESR